MRDTDQLKESAVKVMRTLLEETDGPTEELIVLALMASFVLSNHMEGNTEDATEAFFQVVQSLTDISEDTAS